MCKKLLMTGALSSLLLLAGCQTFGEKNSGSRTIFQDDFSLDCTKAWSLPEGGRLTEDNGNPCLEITATEKKTQIASVPIAFSKYRRLSCTISVRVKAENVTRPRNYWNGVKLIASYNSPGKGRQWKNISEVYGTFDWKEVKCSFLVEPDAEDGTLGLGLQDSDGKVWFDDAKVTVTDLSAVFQRFTPEEYTCEYTKDVLKRKTYRGCMSPASFTPTTLDKDLPDLRSWGANLIRWQLIRQWHARNNNQDCDEYLLWVRKRIPEIRQVLDKCQELGMKVVLDLHVAPGGRGDDGHMNMFREQKFADAFEQAWLDLATAVKGHPALYGYDLINEPSQPYEATVCDYLGLQYRVAKTVRSVDPDTPIIIESNGWDSPAEFNYLTPLPMKNIIYQAHMYYPGAFTHQGVGSKSDGYTPIAYPNSSRNWNKDLLRKQLQTIRDFQLKYGAKIYIGEFSAARWAEGAENYLQDCIDLFEEFGWDWSYHAFRESATWDVEREGTSYKDVRPAQSTPRKEVLLKAFQKNH